MIDLGLFQINFANLIALFFRISPKPGGSTSVKITTSSPGIIRMS